MPKKSYRTIISMIAGSLVGNDNADVHEDHMNQEESPNHQNERPTLSDAASSWEVELDEKQFIAFKVICCSFFSAACHKWNRRRHGLVKSSKFRVTL